MSESQIEQVLEENIEKEVEDKLEIEEVEIQKVKEDQGDKEIQEDLPIVEEKLVSLRINEENQEEGIRNIEDEIQGEENKANKTDKADKSDDTLLEESHKDEKQIITTVEQNDSLHNTTVTKIPIEEKSKFYDNLRTVIKTQENILTMTCMAKEKIKYANEISVDQLKNFKENSLKYGKYLKMIHEELQMVGDLMKKIKKEVK
jgi:hypothetical protein